MKPWCVLLFLAFVVLSDQKNAPDVRNGKECYKNKGVCRSECPANHKDSSFLWPILCQWALIFDSANLESLDIAKIKVSFNSQFSRDLINKLKNGNTLQWKLPYNGYHNPIWKYPGHDRYPDQKGTSHDDDLKGGMEHIF